MNIIKQIQKNEKFQSNIYSLLFEKDEDSKNNKMNNKASNERNKNGKLYSDKISKKCNTLLSSIYDKINIIKGKSEIINKINSKSLQNISKKIFRINTTTSLKNMKNSNNIKTINSTQSTNFHNSSNNFHKKHFGSIIINQKKSMNSNLLNQNKFKIENNIRTIEPYQSIKKNNQNNNKRIASSLFNIKNSDDKLKHFASINIEELYKTKDSKVVNMERLNEAFRIEMNNTFYKYNPKKHIKKLNEMQIDNMSLRQNMQKIKEKINNKVENLCSKKDLLKRYNEIIKSKKKNFNFIHPRNIAKNNPFQLKFKSQGNINPFGYKTRALYSYHTHSLEIENKNKRNKRANSLKEINPIKLFNINIDIMNRTLKKLYVSLDTKNIIKYINDMKNGKVSKNEEISEYKKNKYFPVFKEVKNYLKEYELNKIKYKESDKEKIEKQIIDIENKLLKNINDNKKKLLNTLN